MIDHIPHIADYCVTNCTENEGLGEALSTAILPSVVRCLHDNDNQVKERYHLTRLYDITHNFDFGRFPSLVICLATHVICELINDKSQDKIVWVNLKLELISEHAQCTISNHHWYKNEHLYDV